jgi:competence protein ComEA
MKTRSISVHCLILALGVLVSLAAPLAAAETEGRVNVNTASLEELTYLPRVGSVVAQRILDFREANGRFKEPEDLMLVQGIGERTFELIKPYVAIDGETTLSEKVRLESDEER